MSSEIRWYNRELVIRLVLRITCEKAVYHLYWQEEDSSRSRYENWGIMKSIKKYVNLAILGLDAKK